MYQAYVIQKFNGEPYVVLIGDDFETTNDAMDAINMYEKHFGKCEFGKIEPSGTPLPVNTKRKQKKSIWTRIVDYFNS